MTKRLAVLVAVATGALALPFIAKANEPSHNVGGERGFVFHDARGDAARADRYAMARPLADSGWRYVGGEVVWIYEGPGNRSAREPAGRTDARAAERPQMMQRAQFPNDIYHGA
ncbi:MAG: hypothetical protein H0V63_14630 [Burkholderiaceae bacterium]|nr:hypothetical protein [Burkholderiaceae bacterium]